MMARGSSAAPSGAIRVATKDWAREGMSGVANPTKRAILIAGPTASGKSAVAAAVAERLGGVVVNADSMQVYRDLRILTARPSEADEARVPHRLFGHVDAACNHSVGHWLREMVDVLADAAAMGQVPVLVGGTGLYLKALTLGLSAMPAVPFEIRDRLRAEAGTRTAAELHARLAERDPVMAARLRPTDTQRVLRALEILEATGTSLAVFQQVREPALLPADQVIGVFLSPERGRLYDNIDRRFAAMVDEGAMPEVARLAARDLNPALPAMRALGVPELIEALQHPSRLSLAVSAAKQATRHYAKRQLTFARHQLPSLLWVEPVAARDTILHTWDAQSQ